MSIAEDVRKMKKDAPKLAASDVSIRNEALKNAAEALKANKEKIFEANALDMKRADENGIAWQTKEQIAGGTDGSAVQRSREGVRTAIIATAVRNIHSPVSVAHTADAENVLKLARLFLQEMGKEA